MLLQLLSCLAAYYTYKETP